MLHNELVYSTVRTIIFFVRTRIVLLMFCALLAYWYYLSIMVFMPPQFDTLLQGMRSTSTNVFYRWLSSRGLSDDSLALLKALYTGDKTHLHTSFKEIIRASGLQHLFALSGFHLEVCVSVLSYLVKPLPTRIGQWFVLCLLWVYCWWVAFPASLVRAAVMISVRHSIQKRRIRFSFVYVCALSFLICVLIIPYALTSVSLVLSFLAVVGVRMGLVVSQSLYRHMPVFIADMLGIGITVMASTAWYVFIIFKKVHLVGIVATLVASPIIVVIMYLGLLILCIPSGYVVSGFVYVFDGLTELLIFLCVRFSQVGALYTLGGLILLYAVLALFFCMVLWRAAWLRVIFWKKAMSNTHHAYAND